MYLNLTTSVFFKFCLQIMNFSNIPLTIKDFQTVFLTVQVASNVQFLNLNEQIVV